MTPRFVLTLLAVAFGDAVVGATITPVRHIKLTASAHSGISPGMHPTARHRFFGI
jgi:hypothetical protein